MRTLARLAYLAALLVPAVAFACGGSTLSPGGGSSSSGDGGTGTGSGTGSVTETCNVVRLVPPVLTVLNAINGIAVCNAVLVNNDAGANLSSCTGSEGCTGTCPYTVRSLGGEGTSFSVTISAPGYIPVNVPNLNVQTCGCSGTCAGPQEVTVKLQESTDSQEGVPLPDSGVSPCPVSQPSGPSESCSTPNVTCEYGESPDPYCNDLYECSGAMWLAETGPACPVATGACPTTYGSATGSCSSDEQICPYAQGTCICTSDPGGLPIENGPVWSCTPTTAGCPAVRPDLGTPCSAPASRSCDYGQCSGGVAESCQGGYWQLSTDNACPA
jgi:hypothetical protein